MSNYPIQNTIDDIYNKYINFDQGEVATYIPELGKADPQDFGICIISTSGQIFHTGDFEKEFTIQSISKPFAFGLAIETWGRDTVAKFVGIEPSGDAFNSIQLEKTSNKPFNPMINSGAIAISSLLYKCYKDAAFDVLIERFGSAAGRQLTLDANVYQSELSSGHRNRAIAHLLLNFGILEEDVDDILDLYFKQCSILVNTHDLAMMSATLSNLGKNPITGKDVFSFTSAKDMLSVMLTCGMYDYSGEWAYNVGVPAKSGVSGGIMAAINRQLGFAVYSPKLDARGNSARGIQVCMDLADELGLHIFDCMNYGSNYLKAILNP